MRKTAAFKLFGLFGYPLGHTLSPYMHEAAFRALGIDASYLVLELSQGAFTKTVRGLSRSLLSGFNVTVPYKETVMKYLDKVTPEAKAIGAVNTVYKRGRSWLGTNTDMEGFLLSLSQEGGFDPRNKNAVVLGAGGASRAVTYGLCKKGVRAITIVDAVPGKARGIVRGLRKFFRHVRLEALLAGDPAIRENVAEADLVVNATPLGLKKTDPTAISASWIPRSGRRPRLFMDLIYNPVQTAFLKAAKERGHRTLNGLGMLVLQGARAFQYWTGKKPPVAVMRKAALAALGAKGK